MNVLKRLQVYMRKRKAFLPLSIFMSAISSLLSMVPFVLIWLIFRELIKTDSPRNFGLVETYAWWAMGTAIGAIALYFLALMTSHLAAFRVEIEMRRMAMKKVVKFPLGFFDNNTSGRIRKIIDDNASITHSFLAHQIPDLAGTIVMPLATLVMIFIFNWQLGLACIVPVIIAMCIMSFMMGNKGRSFMKSYMNSLEEMNTEAVEYVRGVPVVKVFQQTIFSFKNFHKSIIKYRNMVTAYTKMWEKPMSTYTVIINGFVFFLTPVAILLVVSTANYANVLVDFFFYVLITPVFAHSIMRSMHLNQAFGQASEAINRMENLIDVEPLKEASNPKPIVGYGITFNNVSFAYPGATKKAINGISFALPQGKTIALVGASGSGKTTIARLIPRFWDVDEGSVSIGDANVKEIDSKELMRNVSFVFQNTKLFKTSLLENLKYGNPNATQEEIERAIDLAQCREIIDRLPEGLQTKIGIDGTYLSGGEQQRFSLARAILKDAPIIVLDEATAFADPENEHLIQQALKNLTKGKTVLMIAHRLSSVRDVDNILVINEGKIAEQGKHKDLLEKQGVYSKMWNEYQKSVNWTIRKEIQYA